VTEVTPCLLYEDAEAAVEFLTKSFGFEEQWSFAQAPG
jgi:uncharacterized glyoxalase superfamily protein PhnB